MNPFYPLSNIEQLAAHLREEIRAGRLNGTMPGVARLVGGLEVGTKTAIGAIELLQREGILVPQGNRRGRRIVLTPDLGVSSMRVQILLYSADDTKSHYNVELQQRLQGEGHTTNFASKTLVELGMSVTRVARFVARNPADVWVVFSGSREVLQWFSEQDTPAFAFAGRRRDIRIASTGPDKLPAIREAVRRLVALGHSRIVMLAHEVRRKPHPGAFEQAYLDELEACGIPVGDYNLPGWKGSPEAFHQILDSLFQHTPPTAIIVEEPVAFVAAQNHLALRGIVAPRDVSLICDDPDPAFAWCQPSVAHIRWNSNQCISHILRWVNSVARGNSYKRHSFSKAEYVEGGTVGPAPK